MLSLISYKINQLLKEANWKTGRRAKPFIIKDFETYITVFNYIKQMIRNLGTKSLLDLLYILWYFHLDFNKILGKSQQI